MFQDDSVQRYGSDSAGSFIIKISSLSRHRSSSRDSYILHQLDSHRPLNECIHLELEGPYSLSAGVGVVVAET